MTALNNDVSSRLPWCFSKKQTEEAQCWTAVPQCVSSCWEQQGWLMECLRGCIVVAMVTPDECSFIYPALVQAKNNSWLLLCFVWEGTHMLAPHSTPLMFKSGVCQNLTWFNVMSNRERVHVFSSHGAATEKQQDRECVKTHEMTFPFPRQIEFAGRSERRT